MEIAFRFNAAENCCYVNVSGQVYPADVQACFDTAYADEQYRSTARALWDFSTARLRLGADALAGSRQRADEHPDVVRSRAASESARNLADYAHAGLPESLPGRVAIVAGSDLDLGMMRVYLGYAAFEDMEIQVFKGTETARNWLFAGS